MRWTKVKTLFNICTDRKVVRQFGLILAGLVVIYFVVKGWQEGELNIYGIAIGVFIFLFALIYDKGLLLIYIPWMVLARIIGFIVTHILLAIVFYLIFTPMGIIMRLAGRDPLQLRKELRDTYWIRRDPDETPRMNKMF